MANPQQVPLPAAFTSGRCSSTEVRSTDSHTLATSHKESQFGNMTVVHLDHPGSASNNIDKSGCVVGPRRLPASRTSAAPATGSYDGRGDIGMQRTGSGLTNGSNKRFSNGSAVAAAVRKLEGETKTKESMQTQSANAPPTSFQRLPWDHVVTDGRVGQPQTDAAGSELLDNLPVQHCENNIDLETMQAAFSARYYELANRCRSWERYAAQLKAEVHARDVEIRILEENNAKLELRLQVVESQNSQLRDESDLREDRAREVERRLSFLEQRWNQDKLTACIDALTTPGSAHTSPSAVKAATTSPLQHAEASIHSSPETASLSHDGHRTHSNAASVAYQSSNLAVYSDEGHNVRGGYFCSAPTPLTVGARDDHGNASIAMTVGHTHTSGACQRAATLQRHSDLTKAVLPLTSQAVTAISLSKQALVNVNGIETLRKVTESLPPISHDIGTQPLRLQRAVDTIPADVANTSVAPAVVAAQCVSNNPLPKRRSINSHDPDAVHTSASLPTLYLGSAGIAGHAAQLLRSASGQHILRVNGPPRCASALSNTAHSTDVRFPSGNFKERISTGSPAHDPTRAPSASSQDTQAHRSEARHVSQPSQLRRASLSQQQQLKLLQMQRETNVASQISRPPSRRSTSRLSSSSGPRGLPSRSRNVSRTGATSRNGSRVHDAIPAVIDDMFSDHSMAPGEDSKVNSNGRGEGVYVGSGAEQSSSLHHSGRASVGPGTHVQVYNPATNNVRRVRSPSAPLQDVTNVQHLDPHGRSLYLESSIATAAAVSRCNSALDVLAQSNFQPQYAGQTYVRAVSTSHEYQGVAFTKGNIDARANVEQVNMRPPPQPEQPLHTDAAPATTAYLSVSVKPLADAPNRAASPHTHSSAIQRANASTSTDAETTRRNDHRRLYLALREELSEEDLAKFERYVHRYDALEIPLEGARGLVNRVKKLLLLTDPTLRERPSDLKKRKDLAREFERVVRVDLTQ